MPDIKNTLSKVPLFAKLSDTELTAMLRHASIITYPKNTVIMSEGDPSSSLYTILTGKVKVFLSDENGKEITINVQGVHDYFGELALLDDTKRSASVITLEKSTLMIVSKTDFKEILRTHPEVALNLIKALTQRVRLLTDNVKSLALLDVYGRVAKILLNMATDIDGRLVIQDKITQQEIANRVGASREMVARILKDLAAGDHIRYEGKCIIVNDQLK